LNLGSPPADSRPRADGLRIARYGGLLGGIVGLTATALVTLVYLYFAYGRGPANPGGAMAGALLLSAVVGFPGSLAVLAVVESLGPPGRPAMLSSMLLPPLLNWLVLGTLAGAIVDAGRWFHRRRSAGR
jgi:hypothetical protein